MRRVFDPAATAGDRRDVETERPVHQRRPGPGVGGDGGAGLARGGGGVWAGRSGRSRSQWAREARTPWEETWRDR